MKNRYLKTYLDHRPPHLAVIRSQELPLYQPYLPLKTPVLDFGCGDGFFFRQLEQKEPVIGLETHPIPEAQSVYKKVYSVSSPPYPFRDDSFSTIVANCVFEHISNLPPIIKELNRVLKPGGALVGTVATNYFPDYLFLKFIPGYQKFFNKISKHHSLLSESEWRQLFKKAGFGIEIVTPYLNNQKLMALFDLSHWLGIHHLISKKLTGKWNHPIFSWLSPFWQKIIEFLAQTPPSTKPAPYLLVVVRKN